MKREGLTRDIIKKVEDTLKNYPFWLLRLETPNLGSPSNYDKDKVIEQGVVSVVESAFEYEEYIKGKVKIIEGTMDLLDKDAKTLIDLRYFKDMSRESVWNEMSICKNTYYRIRKEAIEKYAIGLGYIKAHEQYKTKAC